MSLGRTARVCRTVAVSAGFGIGVLVAGTGALVAPVAVAVTWVFALLLVGPVTAVVVHTTGRTVRAAVVAGATVTGAAMAVGAFVAGAVVVLGAAAPPVLVPAVAAVVVAGLRYRARDPHRLAGARQGARLDPRAADTAPLREPATAPVTLRLPGPALRAASTAELRVAWQRSYWLLHEQHDPARRCEVATIRRDLLDEIERRDPGGFGHWLDARPRANSDPGPHLTTDR